MNCYISTREKKFDFLGKGPPFGLKKDKIFIFYKYDNSYIYILFPDNDNDFKTPSRKRALIMNDTRYVIRVEYKRFYLILNLLKPNSLFELM